jgi:hypothetical protein
MRLQRGHVLRRRNVRARRQSATLPVQRRRRVRDRPNLLPVHRLRYELRLTLLFNPQSVLELTPVFNRELTKPR